MARYKLFTNGGTVLPADLDVFEDDYEYSFSTYRNIGPQQQGAIATAFGTAVGMLDPSGIDLSSFAPLANGQGGGAMYLDPSDLTVGAPNPRTLKWRLRLQCTVGDNAPATTITVAIAPIATWTNNGHYRVPNTVGGTVAGAAFASPGANSQNVLTTTDATAPAAGWFVITATATAAVAANSICSIYAQLQYRQV